MKEPEQFFPTLVWFLGWRSRNHRCATSSYEGAIAIMDETPVAQLTPVADPHTDEPNPSERRTPRRKKAAFQWPPDCLWPFVDCRRDNTD